MSNRICVVILMNNDNIFFENAALSKEIEFLITNIWQRAKTVTHTHVYLNR